MRHKGHGARAGAVVTAWACASTRTRSRLRRRRCGPPACAPSSTSTMARSGASSGTRATTPSAHRQATGLRPRRPSVRRGMWETHTPTCSTRTRRRATESRASSRRCPGGLDEQRRLVRRHGAGAAAPVPGARWARVSAADDLRRAARHAEPRVAEMLRHVADADPKGCPRLGSRVKVHEKQLPLFPEEPPRARSTAHTS